MNNGGHSLGKAGWYIKCIGEWVVGCRVPADCESRVKIVFVSEVQSLVLFLIAVEILPSITVAVFCSIIF